MKRFFLSLALVHALTVGVAPNAHANTVTFPCGGTATYSVLMPAGVAFDGKKCSGHLILDGSVKILDTFAFIGAKITSIQIPNSVTTIYQDALSSTLLTSVDIPSSVTVIPPYAFAFSPLTSVNIPSSIRSIGSGAFYGTNLVSVTIPSSVTSMGSNVFTSTPLSSVTFANGTTFIGNQWFIGVPLTSVNIPDSVQSIGAGAFALSKLSNVVIPNSVRSIGSTAFGSIMTLTTISLPDSVSISSDTFERSYLINRIEYCGLISGFPVAPICPPERQAVIDAAKAKVAADKAAAELKAKQEAEARAAAEKAAAELKAKQEAEARAAAEKAAAELKAKQEAEARAAAEKAAAELKAKQEAEAKAKVEAELKAKQEAEVKAAAELKARQEAEAKAAAELKVRQEAEAKAAAELKAKQETEAKAAAELKAKQEAEANRKEQTISVTPLTSGQVQMNPNGISVKVSTTSNLSVFAYNSTNNVCEFLNGIIRTKTQGRCVIAFSQEGNSDYKPASNLILDFTIVSAATKKTTITCVKGKLTKKVIAFKPVCPAGYKVKK